MANIDVSSILQQLSDQEKIALLSGVDFWHTKSLPQYGIPSLRFSDGPNGVRGTRFFNGVPAACLPCGTALGATFDRKLIYDAGCLISEEMKAKGAHVSLGPTINIQRGPLGGRGFESYSEDPVLSGLTAAAFINGIQSDGIVSTLKHFVCNDQEHERNKVNSIVTERALREIYLMPFQIAIRDSNPKAIMSSYNKVNGIHVAEDKRLLNDVLREEWGWKGLIMSDWFGTYSTSEAVNAGLDLEMPGPSRWRGQALALAASTNKLEPTALDDCAKRVLELVNACAKSGVPERAPEKTRDIPETAALLRRLAAESIVLMKNEGNILPFNKDKKTLVIGPNATFVSYCGGGSAALRPYYTVSPLEGITSKVGKDNVSFTTGAYSHKELPDLASFLKQTKDSATRGVTFLTYNEPPKEKDRVLLDQLTFETSTLIFLDYHHPKLKYEWYADIEGYLTADRNGDFEFGICVYGAAQLFVDEKLVIDVTEEQTQGTAFLGCGTEEVRKIMTLEKGRVYYVKLEFASAPFSKLKPTGVVFGGGAVRVGGAWVIHPEEEIKHAAELAKEVDQVVVCIGLNMNWESEGFDRTDMKLPGYLDKLTYAVLKANRNTAIVVQSGTPVDMPWVDEAAVLLQAWYGGNETGNGIADVLFGDVNPSGKLPLSFPKRLQDNPSFLNYRSEAGRVLYGEDVYVGYRWYDSLDLPVNFAFGHGLSYTDFEFSDLTLDVSKDFVKVNVSVSNIGARDGTETIQAYIKHANPAIKRPVKELKHFEKVRVPKSGKVSVQFEIPTKYACSYYDERTRQWIAEKGAYGIIISNSSKLVPGKFLEMDFALDETIKWKGL